MPERASIDRSPPMCQRGVKIARAESLDEIVGCLRVRLLVFVAEQGVPLIEEVDDYDRSALHYIARCGEQIVACARLAVYGDGVGKIGRLAVLKPFRGQGIGSALMDHILGGDGRRYRALLLDAQVQVVGFYERRGFAVEGGVFLDAGIPHLRMRRGPT